MSTGVAIVGAAESDLGVTNRSILGLQAQAVSRALDDAGLTLRDVDGIATTGVSRFSATQLADYFGIEPRWTDSTFAGGSAFEMFVARAVQAIQAGQAETVVISFASNQRSARSRSLGGVVEDHTPEAQFETPYGPLYPLSYYAMAAQRYLHTYGKTREQLAEIAVAAREWALLNPAAFRYGKGPLTADDVVGSAMISSPLTALDSCLVTDGGGAVVLTSAERARDLRRRPVEVLGYGERTTNTSMTAVPDLTVTGAAGSGADAFARAGVTPADIDVVQVYDSFTITVALTLEGLGFCGRGEALDWIAGGRIRPGGDFPLNTSGGGLSYCHPGQFGILLLVEAVRQLRGECGDRQVPDARLAVAHGTGGILSTHATVVLGVDA
ncbi:acetyl-CoA acetyltransferase [Actinomadura hallensis]|uniref:Acetyl-CoA acetyltransferase n=1 Tax=Actinomadura hallensis TaxID=337895 RepID=A0A543I7A6_9ACTN|nr:acetyl-CoA acetyltransferase [Actinomadura hallensis]TQM66431.1 acetyl-CoA acetyltransferase [Actinomadura hallensis]HLV75631.1 acetyl-CoA acetyltransferase [Vulgatibacteraceae bacterium]